MNNKSNFFKKLITCIYNIRVFSKYAKEGIFRAISYSFLLTFILSGIKSMVLEHGIDKLEVKPFVLLTINNFGMSYFNFFVDCLLVTAIASIITIFMKLIVKYFALYSLTLYAATLPVIMQTILEIINPDISFDTMFIIGTLTYVILILKYIKDDIIHSINSKSNDN